MTVCVNLPGGKHCSCSKVEYCPHGQPLHPDEARARIAELHDEIAEIVRQQIARIDVEQSELNKMWRHVARTQWEWLKRDPQSRSDCQLQGEGWRS